MTPLFVTALSFIAVTALVGTLMFIFGGPNQRKAADRLDTLTGRRRKEDDGGSILRKTAFEGDKRSLLAAITPALPSLQKLFIQADCNIAPNTLLGIGLLLAVVSVSAAWVGGVAWFFLPIVGLVMFCVPLAWLLNKRRLRLKKFSAQLSDALELVARALRAGHSLAAGMHVVAEEMPSPIADEFNRVYEEQNLGIPIEEALKSMCERVPNLDLRFFVTSVMVQRQTGGDLSEILDKIGYVIRERYRILGQIQALTAEGRLSGVILIALPFSLFLLMLYIKPDYVAKLWEHELGIKMSVAALVAQLVGAIVIKKIVNIKV
jgi:tight adherence protein B